MSAMTRVSVCKVPLRNHQMRFEAETFKMSDSLIYQNVNRPLCIQLCVTYVRVSQVSINVDRCGYQKQLTIMSLRKKEKRHWKHNKNLIPYIWGNRTLLVVGYVVSALVVRKIMNSVHLTNIAYGTIYWRKKHSSFLCYITFLCIFISGIWY